jgi:hypothetical protein
MCDLSAVWLDLGFVGVEGSEYCAFSALRWFGMIDAIYEDGKAEDIGEKDELLE